MDEQGIEIADLPLLFIVGGKRIMPGIGLIEGRLETAEEGRHGKVHAAMPIVGGRVDEDGLPAVVTKKIAAPEIAVQ
jgi:hypothetical protein